MIRTYAHKMRGVNIDLPHPKNLKFLQRGMFWGEQKVYFLRKALEETRHRMTLGGPSMAGAQPIPKRILLVVGLVLGCSLLTSGMLQGHPGTLGLPTDPPLGIRMHNVSTVGDLGTLSVDG